MVLPTHDNCTKRTNNCTRANPLQAKSVGTVIRPRSTLIADSFGAFPPSAAAYLESSNYLDHGSYDVARLRSNPSRTRFVSALVHDRHDHHPRLGLVSACADWITARGYLSRWVQSPAVVEFPAHRPTSSPPASSVRRRSPASCRARRPRRRRPRSRLQTRRSPAAGQGDVCGPGGMPAHAGSV